MRKLIELDAALDALGERPMLWINNDEYTLGARNQYDMDRLAIESVPTVDAVPVVRCRDCKHHHYSECEIPYCGMIDYGYGWKDEDFCSRGERKDGENGTD